MKKLFPHFGARGNMLIVLFSIMLFVFSFPLFAEDYGLLLNQNFGLGGTKDNLAVDYSAALIPYFSTPFGDTMELYVSASAQVSYENNEWNFIPELLQTDFAWRSSDLSVRAGRMNYSDPLGFIASGLFDGAQVSHESGAGTFSAGAWYTGFIAKRSARITMTAEDKSAYVKEFTYGDFIHTYFSSRRVLAALEWEHSALAELIRANVSVLGQFDFNGLTSSFHSQYIVGKIGMPFKSFDFNLGGTFEIAEVSTGDDLGIQFAYVGEASVSWLLPTWMPDQLSFVGRFASGGSGGDVIAFVPLTTKIQGDILKADFSALSVFSLGYLARLHKTFSAALNTSLFLRTDLATFTQYPVVDGTGHFLGGEIFTRLYWSPLSDIRITGGGGIFLPSSADAGIAWRVELGILAALY
ncbi:MAG: hypothetical protein LBV20_00385 [Treponema sp.]|jgi:hypothetical protein|nr:hypothetical protein [Treponema sp.]